MENVKTVFICQHGNDCCGMCAERLQEADEVIRHYADRDERGIAHGYLKKHGLTEGDGKL